MNQIKTPYVYKECEIKDFGAVYASEKYTSESYTFNEVLESVINNMSKDGKIISFRDLAYFRVNLDTINDSEATRSILKNSSYVNQRMLCVPGEKINTYWLNLPTDKEKEFSKNLEIVRGKEPFLKSDFDIKYFLSNLSEKECFSTNNIKYVNIKDLNKDESMIWLYEDMVESIQELLLKNKITKLSINMPTTEYINTMPKPFSTKMWSLGVDSQFAISCGGDYTGQRIIRGFEPFSTKDFTSKVNPIDLYKPNTDPHTHFF